MNDLWIRSTGAKQLVACIGLCFIVSGLAAPGAVAQGISAVWANDGGDKVAKGELRTAIGRGRVLSSVWNGTRVALFGAREEVIGFNLVIEAAHHQARQVVVRLDELVGPNGAAIATVPSSADAVFDWTHRPIELFFVRYLPIRGLSRLSYDTYDERHVPKRMALPQSNDGVVGTWTDRPDHDALYPDIAVPLEAVGAFDVSAQENQSVWCDIYIPNSTPPGRYVGTIVISEHGEVDRRIPVVLDVLSFTLPTAPTSKTMIITSYEEVARRYTGIPYPQPNSSEDALTHLVLDRQVQMAHRHRLSLVDANEGAGAWSRDAPRPEWIPRLDGSLFTAARGYAGPGAGNGVDVFSIGNYGHWRDWAGGATREALWSHTNSWEVWFATRFPTVERFLYLVDESNDYSQTQRWAAWLRDNPGPGGALRSFATAGLVKAQASIPALDIVASTIAVADRVPFETAFSRLVGRGGALFLYNGQRPASGSFAVEDDGVALRELPWGQYKKKVARWFYWEATYYNDYQNGRGQNNLFHDAQTFGGPVSISRKDGLVGSNSSNGDGVLFYPGTDRVHPGDSYGLAGPLASLRLKHWRRGVQDVDYIALAHKVDAIATDAIVAQMARSVLWENGVDDPADPTWKRCPIGWSVDPDDWERARAALAAIIEGRSHGKDR